MAIIDTIKNQILTKPQESLGFGKQEQPAYISKLCPHCHGCMLEFTENDSQVFCYACDQSVSVAELLATQESPAAAAAPAGVPVGAMGFITVDTPESGLIYLENRFLNYDWKSYGQITTILIPEIESMVQSNNIKQGAHPYSWLLDFQSISVPLTHKLEALDQLAEEITICYSDEDAASVLALFDRSKNIAFTIVEQRDALLKRMANDIYFAEKLGLEVDKLEAMKGEYKTLTDALAAVTPLKKLTDIPSVAKRQEQINQQMIASFRDKGIDVVAKYEKALRLYNAPTNDKRDALAIFESIRGYADANEYIDKINNYFSYYGRFFHFFGKNYVFKIRKANPLALDPKSKDGKSGCFGKKKKNNAPNEEELFNRDTFELYEVINNEPADVPILRSITSIIRYYGCVLYYVRLDKYVCAYDMVSRREHLLLQTDKAEDLKVFVNGLVYASADNRSIYIRKRLDLLVEKPGCKDKLMGKKETVIQRRNNYEVYELDLVNCACRKVIDRVVDIIDQGGDYLFYTVAEELAPGQVETEETKKQLRKLAVVALHTGTHEKQLVLEENCYIEKICGKKIIYTIDTPNDLNKNLHILDISTMENTLVEANIYRFLAESDGRIFYYVGNRDYAPLFSNNFQGTDRVEVMTNIETVIRVLAGWMYVVKGRDRNALLMKVSTDGKKRMVICSQFKKAIKVTDTYIYYVSSGNNLYVVRTDGKENTLIAENIDLNNVQIDQNRIYYIRHEMVGKKLGASLYVMDIEGHNVRKILFNVRSMKNYDENTLYVERDDKIRFHIVFPAPRKKDRREYDETFELSRYYKFDKNTYTTDNILTVGMPHPNKYQLKGCIIGKKKDMESIFTEIPIEDEFEEQGERAGSALNAQMAEQQASMHKPAIGGQSNGCTPGCGSGCLGALTKKKTR